MCETESLGVLPPGEHCTCGEECRTLRKSFRFSLRFSVVLCLVLTLLHPSSCASPDPGKSTLISQSEVKTIEPTNNPTKVFVRRRIFRKLVKENGNSSTEAADPPETTTSPRPRTLYSLVKRLDPTSTVTGNTLKTSISNSQSLTSRQKFNFQSLKTRLGLAASGIAEQQSTTTPPPASSTQNNSLVMIPLPPSQRKPYTPVIMQVNKQTTPTPTVQTFKLNKMFVPIGIYGTVVENSTTSPPPPSSSTPSTSIRHKGTDSGEKTGKQRKVKGIAESVDLTYGRPNLDKVSLTTEHPDASKISITTEYNELFGGLFGGDDNDVRRGDTNRRRQNKQPFTQNSGLTLMTPPKLGTPSNDENSPSTFQDALGSYSSYSNYGTPHKKFTPSSIVDSITDSMSRIPSLVPSLFHKGLTSLASMTSSLKENPFEDDNFDVNVAKKQKPLISAPSSYTPKIPASVPGGYISGTAGTRDQSYAASEMKSTSSKVTKGTDLSEYETLEYFRKRPHLLAQLRRERAEAAWRRSNGVRLSKGFKPVNAPDYLAREYYKSTSTTQVTPEDIITAPQLRSGKRGSWLLRNSNEYVADKNDKVVRMWRSLLDSFSTDEDPDFTSVYSIRRMDSPDIEDPSSSSISARRSSTQPSTVLNAHWSSIKRKYSKSDINEAKERILTLLDSGYGDEALHDIADEDELQHYHETSSHMPPPPPPRIKALSLTKGLSGAAKGAFKDIVKFFKLGVSVGTGHSREPVNYEHVVDEQEAEEVGGSEWKPVRRPLISFSAGISLKNPLSKKPHHHVVHEEYEDSPLTHYSSSSKPYIPSTYKGLTSYYDEYSSSHDAPTLALKPTPYSYTEDEVIGPSQSLDYTDDEDSVGYGSATSYASQTPKYYSAAKSHHHVEPETEGSLRHYTTLKPGQKLRKPEVDMQAGSASSWSPSVSLPAVNPNEYELVPSSVYLNGQHDPRDIAAVVKPQGVSDEAVRSVLPAGLRSVRILDYPGNGYSNLNTISQVLGGESGSFKNAMKKLRENYVAKESAYLPVEEEYSVPEETSVRGVSTHGTYAQGGYGLSSSPVLSGLGGLGATYYSPVTHQSGLVSALSGLERGNVFATADRINNLGRGSGVVGGLGNVYAQAQAQQGQKDELGFTTNYNLPSNIDPDIAALLKSELDKDDVPEDVRQEFLEAKEQERKEQAQKQQQSYQQASRRVDNNVDLAQRTLIDSLLSSAASNVHSQDRGLRVNPTTPVPVQNYVQEQQRFVAQQQFSVQPTNPTPRQEFNRHAQSRAFHLQGNVPPPPGPPVVSTRFFAPIPITPTLMTAALKNPRYASPVPRYVIELAKKLQGDKSVQGIVRVSAKRGRGLSPIEYLYPVKG